MDYKEILRILGGPDVVGAVRAVAGGRVVDEFGAAVVSARACALGLALRLRLRLRLRLSRCRSRSLAASLARCLAVSVRLCCYHRA